jgi:hypothetical protein
MSCKCTLHSQLNLKEKIHATENIEDIDEWPHKWNQKEISYRLNNYTSDFINQKWQDRAVTVALRCWQLRTPLKFRRERNRDAYVDFNVSFEDLAHFDNRRGVMAHAYFPGQGDISGDVHINDDWNWVATTKFQELSKPPLVSVLIHEFGHSLGLRHDTRDTESIMYPSFDLGKKKDSLGPRDIQRIQERYGERKLSNWIIEYFKTRRRLGFDFR